MFEVPKLPRGVTSKKVYEDYMRWLVGCTEKWIEGNYEAGESMWRSLKGKMSESNLLVSREAGS